MPEHRGPQVVHDALPDLVRQERLPDPEHPGDDGDGDHPARVERELSGVAALNRLQDAAQQERGHHSERGREEDQPEHRAKSQPVGAEEGEDAGQVRAAHRGVTGTLGRRVGGDHEGTWHAATVVNAARLSSVSASSVRRVCVFAGASSGRSPAYAEAARAVGTALAGRGLGLVYGGGRLGLMGAVADAALAGGGAGIGVIPQELVDRELAHGGLTELHVVGSLHERKALMADLADGFVALPGGFGTLDELLEQLTWSQLGLHAKPIGLLDVEEYWRPLVELARHMTDE